MAAFAYLRNIGARQVLAVPGDAALLGEVEPGQEFGLGRLARAVLPDQGHDLAGA